MVKKANQAQAAAMKLDESPWHMKSILVYVAAMVSAADMILQAFFMGDFWGTTTSIILTVFLWIEAYARLMKAKTYLGKLFAPVFSVIVIMLIVGERVAL